MNARILFLPLSLATIITACDSEPVAPQPVTPAARQFTYAMEAGWPHIPAQWQLGDVSGVAVDADNNIWVLQRPGTLPPEAAGKAAPPVMVFDQAGNFLSAWGGPGEGYEWPQNEHGIFIDDEDFVWVTGNACPDLSAAFNGKPSDDQVLKFTRDGEFVMQIGMAGQNTGNTDTGNVHRSADVDVYLPANEIFVADGYGNRRVIVFDADTGAFKRQWGYNGGQPGDRSPCKSTFDTQWQADQFSVVHSIRVADDGTVYVADRENSRVQMFTLAGELVGEFDGNGGMIAGLGLSPDPEHPAAVTRENGSGPIPAVCSHHGVIGTASLRACRIC